MSLILEEKAALIMSALPARGVSNEITAAPSPAGFLSGLLAQLLLLLVGCIPAAKTPQGLADVCNRPGVLIRARLGGFIRSQLRDEYGSDSDGRSMTQMLAQPLKDEVLTQMKSLTVEDATRIFAENPTLGQDEA